MSIDIIIVNYRTPDDLADCLRSLDEYAPRITATLTVVDVGAPSDDEQQIKWQRGTGRRISISENIGYARACNLAAARSGSEQIAFFNADILFTGRSIDLCYHALRNSNSVILGPRQVDTAGKIRHAGIFGTHTSPVHRGWNEPDRGQHCDVREAVTVSGSAYFVKRRAWRQLTTCPIYRDIAPDAKGAFLPTPHYYEETWCSYHAAAHGLSVLYYGYVTMIHKWHRASPLGGYAEQQMPISRTIFRKACEYHDIDCD